MMRLLFSVSLALNLITFSLGSFIIYKKGGFRYLANYAAILRGNEVSIENFSIYYQQRYSEFWGQGIAPKGSIFFVGDSLTEQQDWSGVCGRAPTVNRGISADTSLGVQFRMKEIVRHQPAKIVLMIGIADLRIGRSVNQILINYAGLLNEIKTQSPNTEVFVESVLPINPQIFGREIAIADIEKLNAGIKQITDEKKMKFLNLFPEFLQGGVLDASLTNDGVHLKPNGYQRWREILGKSICP